MKLKSSIFCLSLLGISSLLFVNCKTQKSEDFEIEYITLEEADSIYASYSTANSSQISKHTINYTKEYHISEAGKDFIKYYEKCELTAYPDLGGGWTIGYGHHGKDVKKGMKISKSRANELFNIDIQKTEKYARNLINNLPYSYQFSQEFFDGLCDLIYNAGVGAVQNSTFYARLKNCRVNKGVMNESDYRFVIASVKNFHAPYKGHKIRRNACYQNMIAAI